MQKLIIIHSSDLHGSVKSIPRIATLVEQTRDSNPDATVLYFDSGDAQDKSNKLSKRTEGTAMYHLLGTAGCQASVVSNKCMNSYGMDIIETWQKAGKFPILCSNLTMPQGEPIPGTQPHMILNGGEFKLGIVGATDPGAKYVKGFGLEKQPLKKGLRRAVSAVREEGAGAVILLSHLGLYRDFDVAEALPDVPLILGGHSHTFSPHGYERSGTVISHVGAFGRHVGRIDLTWDGANLTVDDCHTINLRENIDPKPDIMREIKEYS